MSTPYNIENVKTLAKIFEETLEKLKGQHYTYPEIIVAWQQALYKAIYWQARGDN